MKQSIFNRIYQLALMRQTVFVSFTALLLFIGSHSQAATFKVATLSPDGSFWMKTMRAAGKEVAVATDDRVKFKWYPGGVMGDDKAVLRKMRVGQLQGAALPMGELLSFYPDSQAYGIPFLFRSYEEVDYVRSQLDASLIEGFAEGGMEVLGIAEGGFGYFLATEPVRVPEDLRQQKVWVPQNDVVSARLAQSIGVTPIPLTLPDVLPGLQTGLINTVAVSPIGAIALQWHTRVDYVTDIPLMYFCGVMTLTGKSFNKLSAQDQTSRPGGVW